ncbi:MULTISPECIES: D-alanine--D-alanine ligase [Allobacillus]|uniref:D-alanine--D-alanine ligase n=1 Tax=Allobacillus salarius TaxID=1955272 RepID=A0A556PT66_9BACI|nr:D-alanine--D-alanine ligase [Allobacillus salarius]TSJ67583.1 D-alanine--D-alanine ligase [Allobacillus salarius]
MKIAVLYGGTSKEREVSLSTGEGMINALRQLGYDVVAIDFDPAKLTQHISELENVDFVLIGLHGKQGEDGRVQGFLELLGLPYLGSGVLASSLAMDKSRSKQIFANEGLPIARSQTFNKKMDVKEIYQQIINTFDCPFVIKPNQEGSTLGLTFVHHQEEIEKAIQLAFSHDDQLLVEDFVEGRELTVSVFGNQGEEEALPIIEIIPKNKYYDYEAKYSVGGSEHIVPAKIAEPLTDKIQSLAVKAHQALGCESYSRVDFILNEQDEPIILEVNTLPGMTPTSLYPDAAAAVGLNYEQMLDKLIGLAMKNY